MSKEVQPTKPDYIGQGATRARYNNPSVATFWRWQADPKVGFPKPILIGSRKYWRVSDLEAFEQRQQKAG